MAPSTMDSPQGPAHLQESLIESLEAQAEAVLRTIRLAVDILRPTPPPAKLVSARRKVSSLPSAPQICRQLEDRLDIDSLVQAWQRIEPQLVGWQELQLQKQQHVQSEGRPACVWWRQWQPPTNATTTPITRPHSSSQQEDNKEIGQEHGGNDSLPALRQRLVRRILWPLLELLGLVYTYLDALPSTAAATTTTPPLPLRPHGLRSSGTSKAPPPPPPGLLSLQDYTNIAALLEFTVGVSLVPRFQSYVLAWPRPLPQALRGRLSMSALTLWQDTSRENDGDGGDKNSKTDDDHNSNNKEYNGRSDRNITKTTEAWYEVHGTAARLAVVLQLDRFRPMLLPRHLVDLHAAFWHTEQWGKDVVIMGGFVDTTTDEHYDSSSRASWLTHGLWYRDAWQPLWPTTVNPLVDDTLVAVTCQKLLHHGRQAPVWLQRAAGNTLQAVAHRNLVAVLTVFAPKDDSAAALRLARTLIAGPLQAYRRAHSQKEEQNSDNSTKNDDRNGETMFDPLVAQMRGLLDQIVHSATKGVAHQDGLATASWTQVHRSQIEFFWALLQQLPLDIVHTRVFGMWNELEGEAEHGNCRSIHACVHRWTALFLFVPPFVDILRWTKLLCSTGTWQVKSPDDDLSILHLLWHLASSPKAVMQSSVQADATYALQLWSQAILAADCWKDASSLDVFGFFLLHLLQPFAIEHEISIIPNSNDLDQVTIQRSSAQTLVTLDHKQYVANQVAQLESRAKFAVIKLILPLSQESVAKANTGLPSRLLQILVALYLSLGSTLSTEEASLLPNLFLTQQFELVTLTLLPVLCEECSLENLLSDPSSSIPLWKLIRLALDAASHLLLADHNKSSFPTMRESGDVASLSVAADIVSTMFPNTPGKEIAFKSGDSLVDDESRISVASVLLTVLVSVLELGSPSRSSEEEAALKALIPSLTKLSQNPSDVNLKDTLVTVLSEMSEMASHANALIAARSAPSVPAHSSSDTLSPIKRQFLQAKQDLNSVEPPMRARGVVALRHLASAVDNPTTSALVEDMPTSNDISLSDILSLALIALADKESYVFLAAIQTITAVAMQEPVQTVRQLCSALATGEFRCQKEACMVSLSPEQRIKLAESLVAFVRRRAALAEHLDDIFGTLLYTTRPDGQSTSVEESKTIQEETHRYFVQQNNQVEREIDDDWEETQLKVNTGGPVFDKEENDLVRGAAISLVAEVVRVCPPALLARFAPILVHCAKVSLQLDSSRPVRRSGASLAASLYTAVWREIEEQLDDTISFRSKRQLQCPLTIALVASDESSLVVSLSRAERGADLSDLGNDRHFDPATSARCQEARMTRERIEETGVLALASLSISSQSPGPSILRITPSSHAAT
jgi:hypothetical protein